MFHSEGVRYPDMKAIARSGPAGAVGVMAREQLEKELLVHSTKNDLPASTRSKMVALLNKRLASCVDLESQLKQAHWNVKGPQFIALHELFDKVFNAVRGYVDLIAERAAQLEGQVNGTVRMAAESIDQWLWFVESHAQAEA